MEHDFKPAFSGAFANHFVKETSMRRALKQLAALGCVSGLTFLLGGCALGPDYVRPAGAIPAAYLPPPEVANTRSRVGMDKADEQQTLIEGKAIPAQWWELFHSQPLNDLIDASLRNNPSVDAAQAALRGALAGVAAQQGAFYPTVDAAFAPTRQKVAGTLASPSSSNASYYNLHTAQLSVSYVPDLFGGNQRQLESLTAQAESQRLQNEATYLTLTSNVVNAAIQEASLRGQISASKEIIASQTSLLAILQRQFELGQVATLDVAMQEAALAATEATLPPLEKQLAVQTNVLTMLAGRYPAQGVDATFNIDDLALPATMPLTLPSRLIEQRPDVRAAEEQLHAASAQIGVAIANRLPSVTLGVNAYGSAASALSDLFKSGTGFWTLAASITQPLFDGGMLKQRQAVAQAAYDAAAAQYRSALINAFQNVADALQAIEFDARALRTAGKAQQAAKKSLTIARRQLALGDISALALLSSEQAYQQATLSLIAAQANRLSDTVALFQALGGGWWNK